MVRPSWVEVDLGAIEHNVRVLVEAVAPARVTAVVKADGYGHGDVPVAEAAIDAGADMIGVALVEEGSRLREAGVDAPILLLSEPPKEAAPDVILWGLSPTVYTEDFVRALDSGTTEPIPVHLKIDTGMHRNGVPASGAAALADAVAASANLSLGSVWTHFSVAESDPEFTTSQLNRFTEAVAMLREQGHSGFEVHAANSAGAIAYPDSRLDRVRPGLAIYGLGPIPGIDFDLRPAMRVVSHVAFVHHHPAGTRPSYGRIRPMEAAGNLITVPVGYADGVPRSMSRDAEVLINGRRHRLAGSVTMDQIVVDVGDAPVSVGDEVVLLGQDGEDAITAEDWAEWAGTISWEIVCRIGARLPRRYRR